MQLVPLYTLKDLFPKDSWLWEGLHTMYDILQDQTVLLITEDLVLRNLDLDAPEKSFTAIPKGKSIYQILCTGNLKAKNIYNSDTEGSSGLMVFGDLRCQNMVIGGQQIYVGGNLVASQYFWGDHRHGTLVVKGNVYTNLFLTTDGYHTAEENIQLCKGGTFLKDSYTGTYDEELIEDLFLPACLIDVNERKEYPYTWNHFLDRKEIIIRLSQDLPLLKKDSATPQPERPAVEKIFIPVPETIGTQQEWEEQLPNFLKLYDCCLLEEDNILGFDAHGWEFVVHTAYEDDPNIFIITARNAEKKICDIFFSGKKG